MRILALLAFLLFSTVASAVDEYAKLTGNQKLVVDRISSALGISASQAYKVYGSTISAFVGAEVNSNWYYSSVTNNTLTASRFQNSASRFIQFDVVNDNRLINVTLIKIDGSNQIFAHSLETLPRTAETVLTKQAELKKDPKYTTDADQSQYAVFTEKGKAVSVALFASNGVGAVQYQDSMIIDLQQANANTK